MADGLFGLLGGLEDIQEPKVISDREETLLEKLINLEQKLILHTVRYIFIANLSNRMNNLLNKQNNKLDGFLDEDVLLSSLYSYLAKELGDVEFTEKDISEYVYARANNDDTDTMMFIGLLSGFLLSTLTERNLAQGKGTRFYIDGKSNRFDHLFTFAKTVDELIVENFCGDYTCASVGANEGTANKVVGLNLKGKYVLHEIGRKNGKIGIVFGKDIEGNYALSSIGADGGNVGSVLGFDIKGDSALANIGIKNGNIGIVYGKNIVGDRALASICKDRGKGGVVVGIDINSDDALSFCGSDNGNMGLVYGLNINGEGILSYVASKKGSITLMIGENISYTGNQLYPSDVLSFIANEEGHIDFIIGKNITCKGALSHLGYIPRIDSSHGVESQLGSSLGTIGKLIAIAVKGEEALSYIGCDSEKIKAIRDYFDARDRWKWYKSITEGTEHQFGLEDVPEIKNPPNFIGEEYNTIGEVLCDPETDVTPVKICCKKLVIGNEAVEEYEKIMKEHKLNELVETLRSMYNQPYQKVMEIVESLRFTEMLK